MTNIGVFDTGVGGLSVLSEIIKEKNANYFYLGDSKRAPYGPRDNEQIIKFADQIVEFLENYDIDQYIIACNTISVLATDYLSEKYKKKFYPIPSFGVKEALKNPGDYLVLGTEATVNSHYYKNSLEGLTDSKVFEVAAGNLVPLIEQGKLCGDEIDKNLKEYLSIANEKRIPNIILACTHYPLIKDAIKNNLIYEANIINPATCLAGEINFVESTDSNINIFFTEINDSTKMIIDKSIDSSYSLKLKEI
ncbi:glutamate racemase [uncultured Anaerococcus sp.]|uniref:glutamate racemase n=1 Tax=uncultured Anaerococcus sp. TaxID=293428 RepID=UPI0026100221|nr:glutamate racemase [uncultured Anaerococcus sp.]